MVQKWHKTCNLARENIDGNEVVKMFLNACYFKFDAKQTKAFQMLTVTFLSLPTKVNDTTILRMWSEFSLKLDDNAGIVLKNQSWIIFRLSQGQFYLICTLDKMVQLDVSTMKHNHTSVMPSIVANLRQCQNGYM